MAFLQYLTDAIFPWPRPVVARSHGAIGSLLLFLSPFGSELDWGEIAGPETIGLAHEGIEKLPSDQIDYICRTFDLKRLFWSEPSNVVRLLCMWHS